MMTASLKRNMRRTRRHHQCKCHNKCDDASNQLLELYVRMDLTRQMRGSYPPRLISNLSLPLDVDGHLQSNHMSRTKHDVRVKFAYTATDGSAVAFYLDGVMLSWTM
jgi:hypothetical protein